MEAIGIFFIVILCMMATIILIGVTMIARENFQFDSGQSMPYEITDPETVFRFHCYWTGILSEKPAASIKSVLATQETLREGGYGDFEAGFKIYLWLDEEQDLKNNKYAKELHDLGVQMMWFNAKELVKGTPLEDELELVRKKRQKEAKKSDWMRILTLYRYGGFYFDLDCMFLKDIAPLLEQYGEFCYRWISRKDKLNTALLHLKKGSQTNSDIIRRAAKERAPSAIHGLSAFHNSTKPEGLNVVPYKLFDFCWIDAKLCPHYNFTFWFDEMPKETAEQLELYNYAWGNLNKSYVYHWHNMWDHKVHPNSIFSQIASQHNKILGLA